MQRKYVLQFDVQTVNRGKRMIFDFSNIAILVKKKKKLKCVRYEIFYPETRVFMFYSYQTK